MAEQEKDAVTGIETTGHEWDGIKELNNPLPRWWLWTFYATIAWTIGYVVLYPAIQLLDSATEGVLGYSSRAEVAETIAEARAAQAGQLANVEQMVLADIRRDEDAFQFAVAGGRAAFAVNCSQCHGSGAQGFPGYPNLNDDAWLWGGGLETIEQTIRHGVRYGPDADTRFSLMPAFGRDGMLDRGQIEAVTAHVLQLAGADHDAAKAEAGAELYADNCAACHGERGEGEDALGAPALNDAIWLYGGTAADIARHIHTPQHGVMPAWGGRLDDVTIKQLAIFVHALGGGE